MGVGDALEFPQLKGHRQMTKTEEETMTKQIEDSHGESNKEDTMKQLDREYDEYIRTLGHRSACDWVEILLTVIIMLVTVIGFSTYLAHLIEMVVDKSKFTYVKAAMDIFWATVFLSQWVYHLADKLVWKLVWKLR